MSEPYFALKLKLEELGYNNSFPVDAVPLVECVLADLLQTTRSLQHYMDLSKEALMQRDSLMMEAEPYKCDNAKLIQENNKLHKEIMNLQEEKMKLMKDLRRKIKNMSEELAKKDTTITKLQHDLRDLSLRGLCAGTMSSRNKSKRKEEESNNNVNKTCLCNERKKAINEKDIVELTNKIHLLEEKNEAYCDEIVLLKNQIEHRDNEIVRLNMLLEGGRPLTAISKDCCNISSSERVQKFVKEIHELELVNDSLKKEIENALEKQHEAMIRALNLADKNKKLQDELQKVDTLALRVEADCNKRLAAMSSEINFLQTRLEGLTMKNSELENQISNCLSKVTTTPKTDRIQNSLSTALKENDALHKEIKDLVDLNKSLQDKILTLSQMNKPFESLNECDHTVKYPTKTELEMLLKDERKKYEAHNVSMQEKMTEIMNSFNKHMNKCKDKDSPRFKTSHEEVFVRDLHARLCESEQRILMLKKENDELKRSKTYFQEGNKQNYKDVIGHLNIENAELSKENIALSQQLSQLKLNYVKNSDRGKGDFLRDDAQKLKDKIDELKNEIHILTKDKQEYNHRYKDALELSEKLKRDLVSKQKEIEHLEEENRSFKVTNRTGKASTEHLKEECIFLREQIRKMQSDVIREKTLANQIKNIQIESERSSNELQNELLGVQKKFSLSKDTIDSLERKCKELQAEIANLRHDKSNLIDNFRKVDQERDKLVIELDNKTENISMLEQKVKTQSFEITKLENDLSDLKRMLTVNKVSEHKLADHETQITFLNGEILRLTQQLDSAIMENKHLQNSLADANGTLKLTRIEYDKSRKELDTVKQQLQHYVEEIRRIEELLSHKEAERSDMLEHFASLSVEANILENTNHSLESESASKSVQLQTYVTKIQSLEEKLIDKESIIDSQTSRITALTCKVSALECEVKLLTEEKVILEQNIAYLKKMCNNLQSEHSNTIKGMSDADTEIKLYENRIKSLSCCKSKLEEEREDLVGNLATTEKLLSNARKEIVELKLALQDATSETKSLQESVSRLRREPEIHEATMTNEDEFILPLTLEEIREVSHEDDESSRYERMHKSYSKFSSHHSTL